MTEGTLAMRATEHRVVGAVAVMLVFLAAFCGSVSAANRTFLTSFGSQLGEPAGHVGFGTGVAVNRAGVGGASAGDVYVPDFQNARVDQFSASGAFVRAFGWDVVASGQDDSAVNEQQSVTVPATVTGGTFRLVVTTATGTGILSNGSNVIQGVEGAQGAFNPLDAIAGTGIPAGTTIAAVGAGTLTMSASATSGETFARAITATETTAAIPFNATAAEVDTALEALPGIGAGNITVAGGPGATAPFLVTFSGGLLAGDDVTVMTVATPNLLTGGTATVADNTVRGGAYEICRAASSPIDRCKAGSKIANAGALANPEGIALDQTSGNVFIANNTNKRVDVYGPTGQFQGAFGADVIPGGATGLEFCTTVSTCKAGSVAATAGAFSSLVQAALAIDPSNGHLYVGDRANLRINEFSFTLNGFNEVTGASFVRAFGWDVIPSGQPGDTGVGLETCTTTSTCKAGTAGAGDGQIPNTSSPSGLAVDSSGSVYMVPAPGGAAAAGGNITCAPAAPCRVQKFKPDGTFDKTYGPGSGGAEACQLSWTAGAAKEQAAGGIAIDPATQNVIVTRKAAEKTYEICEFKSEAAVESPGKLLSRMPGVPRETNTAGYLQPVIGTEERIYVNNEIAGQRGATELFGSVPSPPAPKILPVTEITSTSAQLHGEVTVPSPGGEGFDTRYHFEYRSEGDWILAPVPDATAGNVTGPHPVELSLKGLDPNTKYFVRLAASTSSTVRSEEVTFRTLAAQPTIISSLPDHATQTTVVLTATLNPRNLPTSYHFEWGEEGGTYPNRLPIFERAAGSGSKVVLVRDELTGLNPATIYHFRLVASSHCNLSQPSEVCVVNGPDQTFETLNACGFVNSRCLELVSPADKGPTGGAGDITGTGMELPFKVDPAGSGLLYSIAFGTPNVTAGGEVLYRGTRGSSGWEASQVGPDVTSASTTKAKAAHPVVTLGISDDLACAVMASALRLSPDAPQETIDAGYSNLFLRNEDGTFSVVSNRVPSNLDTVIEVTPRVEYTLIGISRDCGRVVFTTSFQYSGLPGEGSERLYEWKRDDDTLRAISEVPTSPTGSQPVAVSPGALGNANSWHAVPKDGSNVYFSAPRKRADGPAGVAELNKTTIFSRFVDGTVIDVARSQNPAVANAGALYQTASEDGQRVFFLANYGLTTSPPIGWPSTCASSTGTGCELYEYDFSKPAGARVTDLSLDTNGADAAGAGVVAVSGTSADADYVYFAARGQLVAGQGPTQSENLSTNSYSLYLTHAGDTTYIASIGNAGLGKLRIETIGGSAWTTRVSPSGRYLLFESVANITGFESSGVLQTYLFDAVTETTVCVTCRRDGEAPATDSGASLPSGRLSANLQAMLDPPTALTDEGNVFFVKRDDLATGATAGHLNLYEWNAGQIAFLATSEQAFSAGGLKLYGASADGTDVYFSTTNRLTWEDTDDQLDVYDGRSGGGFPEPAAPPDPCDPLAEATCQGSGASPPAAAGPPASSTVTGPGNAQPPKAKCRKGKVRRRGKCVSKDSKTKNHKSRHGARGAK